MPNGHSSETIALLHEDLAQARRERDEARAIARRLATELRVYGNQDDRETAEALDAFDALPWASDSACPDSVDKGRDGV